MPLPLFKSSSMFNGLCLAAWIVLGGVGAASAQSRMGFYLGATYSRLDKPYVDGYTEQGVFHSYLARDYYHPSYCLGTNLEIPLFRRAFLLTGVNYIRKGNRQRFDPYLYFWQAPDTIRSIITVSGFVELPVQFRYTFYTSESQSLSAAAGIGLSNWVRRKRTEVYLNGNRFRQTNRVFNNAQTRNTERTLLTSLAYDWNNGEGRRRIELSYAHGLTDLASDAALRGVFKRFRTQSFSIRFGWWFQLDKFRDRITRVPD
ncbi:MAG: hypothetical protein R2792_08950 [Saprospiraceae bacterium]